MKQRYVRPRDRPADDALVVRGGELNAALLRQDALRNFAIYGRYGVSVFAARDASVEELAHGGQRLS